jgi:hypothetical protein
MNELISDIKLRVTRWKYVLVTYRDYYNRLNRLVEVENILLNCDGLSREECHKLAYKLGVPDEFRYDI